jgi:hypothetical protein
VGGRPVGLKNVRWGGPVCSRPAGGRQAQARLDTGDGAIGVEVPLLVGAAVAVPQRHLGPVGLAHRGRSTHRPVRLCGGSGVDDPPTALPTFKALAEGVVARDREEW